MSDLFQQLQELQVLVEDGNRGALARLDITPTQYQALRSLDRGPRTGMTVTQVADALLCTRGNATRLVRRLLDLGMVQTRSDQQDHRIVVVSATTQGRRTYRAADKVLQAANARRLSGTSAKDRALLEGLIDDLSVALRRDLAEQATSAARTGTQTRKRSAG
jgi:MarR family 2-MHQ and catechol resistance regulon transcriptional repressor